MPPKRKTKTQTVKKPLVETETQNDNTHDGSNEQVEDPKDITIAQLQEEIRLLKIENESLRKNTDEDNFVSNVSTTNVRRGTVVLTPAKPKRHSVQTTKSKEKGCSCTGNCANKKCGCVRKDTECSEFCKCANACQNKNVDENKENEGEVNTSETKVIQKHNISKRDEKTPSSSFSSESNEMTPTQTEKEKEINQPKIEPNPMKPTRQLPRSPLHQPKGSPDSTDSTANTTAFVDDDVFLPVPKQEDEDEEELPPPEGIDDMLIF
ncbi:hypothetical protein PV327_000769 [Microctonus hyperodae]|uniref:Tesmin/TSO1-like CXC domain-containing protein n=1 Tax=Microctonus hyperodae TaxID=165561 RepID=A0AA39G6V1_MICHY|nr:hypothetical protein PV327_000769 [Microctonus hyperodae]